MEESKATQSLDTIGRDFLKLPNFIILIKNGDNFEVFSDAQARD